ncbi:MAG: 50S ribosomal protein L32 [Dehalococcoidia bacterium]|nr:50S ribosomal protein L32 [Dehalococcoidia bacterium]MDP6511218.1 50S ribosomal protein L32 [Dehalococcoidia bacterium]
MAPLPKRRTAKARQRKRRSHLHLQGPVLSECPQCHQPRINHHACPHCGQYGGREVISIKPASRRQ